MTVIIPTTQAPGPNTPAQPLGATVQPPMAVASQAAPAVPSPMPAGPAGSPVAPAPAVSLPTPQPTPEIAPAPAPQPLNGPDNILPKTDASTWDVMGAAWQAETVRTDAWDYTEKLRHDLAQQMFDLLPEDAKTRVDGRMHDFTDHSSFEQIVMAEADGQRKQNPGAWANFPASIEDFNARILDRRKADLAEAQLVLDQPGGGFSEFIATSARDMTDQASLAMLPLGGLQGGVLKTIASEALLGAAGNLVTLPRENQVATDLGLAKPDPWERAITGALLGGGLSGLALGAAKALSMWHSRRVGLKDGTPKGGDAIQAEVNVNAAEAKMRGDQTPAERLADAKAASDTSLGGAGISNTATWQAENLTTVQAPNGEAWTVNKKAAEAFTGFLRELSDLGYEVKSSGGFNYRNIRGSDRLSEHARGLAIDLNAATNPLGGAMSDLPANVGDIAAKYGLKWGGNFKGRKDPMHFEYVVDGGATGSAGQAFTPTTRGYTNDGQVAVGDGSHIAVSYEVVDASSLIKASGDLQPRDRSRAASDAWIADTAARLDPAQLMPAPTADRGAPIIGPDNIVESGNGRVAAINRVYDLHPDRAAAYRAQIEAAGYKVPEGMARPVLIARRTTDMTQAERVDFAIKAQDGGVAALTPTEVAQTSSRAMTAPVLAQLDPAQALTHEANGGFVRSVLASLPRSARNAMFDAGGLLNTHGARQLAEALFARAWSAPDILARYAEVGAGRMKSLLDAMEQAAPAWAVLKADIEAGLVRPEMDISGHVMDAMRLIMSARELAQKEGLSIAKAVEELLADVDMEFGGVSPLTGALVQRFWKNGRTASADDIAGFLTRYAEEARKAGATGAMFAGPTPRDILVKIDPAAFDKLPEDMGQVRGYAQPAPKPVPDLPMQGFDEGATSAEALAADSQIAADLLPETPAAAPASIPAADALSQSMTDNGPRQIIDLQALPPITGKQLTSDLKYAQPYAELDPLMVAATKNHTDLNSIADAAAKDLGLEFKHAPLKETETVIEKVTIKYAGDYTQIADVARTGITAPTIEAADAFIAKMGQIFHLIDEGWITTPAGYFDRKLMVRFDDGQLGELHIWPPGMLEAKSKADLQRFGGYPETYVDKKGKTKPFVGGHKLYEISRDPTKSEAMRAKANADMITLYGEVAAKLDPSFAAKLGFGDLRQASAASASAGESSLARSSPNTSSAISREPPSGAQPLVRDQNMARPASDTAQRSAPSSNSFMGNVLSVSQDAFNMGAGIAEVNSLDALRAQFADLEIKLPDGSLVTARDLLDDLKTDEGFDAFVQACALGGA